MQNQILAVKKVLFCVILAAKVVEFNRQPNLDSYPTALDRYLAIIVGTFRKCDDVARGERAFP